MRSRSDIPLTPAHAICVIFVSRQSGKQKRAVPHCADKSHHCFIQHNIVLTCNRVLFDNFVDTLLVLPQSAFDLHSSRTIAKIIF